MEDGQVSFRWRDYRHHKKRKLMTLPADEFMRRFLLHVLPDGFQRIRHYGFLGNRHRAAKLARCRQLLTGTSTPALLPITHRDYRAHYEHLTGRSLTVCPICQQGHMMRVELLPAVLQDNLGSRGDTS
jgi:hypothetical protein